MKLHEVKSWGVDVGNVLFANIPIPIRDSLIAKKAKPEEYLKHYHLIPDALLGLRMLTQRVGPDNVWIISKAAKEQIALTRLAFDKFRIHPVTGLKKDQVLFCPERKDKRVIIKALELEGHIDDRGEVIDSIQTVIKNPIWFNPTPEDSLKWIPYIKYHVRVVSSWQQIMEMY